MSRSVLITGGAGFIGSNFVHFWLEEYPEDRVVVLDALTYAGNLANLQTAVTNPRFRFYPGRIEDRTVVDGICRSERITHVVNFAAESHNDRSMVDPTGLIDANVTGVGILLRASKHFDIERFLHVSTDEVYGQIENGRFRETDPLLPRTPYSAGKAGGEMLVRAYHIAYGIPTVVTRGSNTFGPYQYPEKLLPFFITRALQDRPLPLYGTGAQVREWLYVTDHCRGIRSALLNGAVGEVYNLGGGNELTNLDITKLVLQLLGKPDCLIRHVPDPRGSAHDARYALDCTRIGSLGWRPQQAMHDALERTVRWYCDHRAWWEAIVQSEAYRSFVAGYYGPILGDDL